MALLAGGVEGPNGEAPAWPWLWKWGVELPGEAVVLREGSSFPLERASTEPAPPEGAAGSKAGHHERTWAVGAASCASAETE